MKGSARNLRTAFPVIAVFVALVLSFFASPLTKARAQTSTSSSSSSSSSSTSSTSSPSSTTSTTSPAQGCHNEFSGGTVKPGDTVRGTLKLSNGCKYTGKVTVSLNGASLQKNPDASGAVSVTVLIKSTTSGTLDDPVDVSLHEGTNTAVVSGAAQTATGTAVSSATINATFVVQAPPTTTTATTVPTSKVTPVTTATTSGGGGLAGTGAEVLAMLAVALFAIVLGSHTLASQTVPFDMSWPALRDMSLPRFDAFLPEQETLQKRLLAAASHILGPPPGRHATKGGPRGLVPTVRDWIYRKP